MHILLLPSLNLKNHTYVQAINRDHAKSDPEMQFLLHLDIDTNQEEEIVCMTLNCYRKLIARNVFWGI